MPRRRARAGRKRESERALARVGVWGKWGVLTLLQSAPIVPAVSGRQVEQ